MKSRTLLFFLFLVAIATLPARAQTATSLQLTEAPCNASFACAPGSTAAPGQFVEITAHLVFSGSISPTGSINILVNGTQASTLTPVTDESWFTSSLMSGADSITANYAGDANYSASSAGPVVLTVGSPAPTAPVLSAAATSNSVVLTWTYSGGGKFTVYRRLQQKNIKKFTKIGSTGLQTYTDTSVSAGSTYYYYVSAVAAGATLVSNTVAAAPGATPPPTVPTIASVSPSSGPAGTAITITGANFVAGATATLTCPSGQESNSADQFPLTNVSLVSSSEITGTVPSGATQGSCDVTVTEP